jgi:hypothetical protein
MLDPEHIARDLDDRVLESTSSPDQWDTPLARVPDRGQRSVHADVRAAG